MLTSWAGDAKGNRALITATVIKYMTLEEQEESLKAGEIIQLCSSIMIQRAQNWLKRYGTHFISGVTMGCEVVQKFRIEKEDVYANQYMHPNDYIQTILGKYSKKRGGEHDVRIILKKHM